MLIKADDEVHLKLGYVYYDVDNEELLEFTSESTDKDWPMKSMSSKGDINYWNKVIFRRVKEIGKGTFKDFPEYLL